MRPVGPTDREERNEQAATDPAESKLWLATALMAAVIVHGSLFPFAFRVPPHGIGSVATFLGSWNERPGRSDFLANIVFYAPFGFFCTISARRRLGLLGALFVSAIAGALLSATMELTQYYDESRVTSATDFYANTMGTLLGGIGAAAAGARFRIPFAAEAAARPAPILLIISWLAYRLYPWVPSTDVRKYRRALEPILGAPTLSAYDLWRQATIWLTLYALIEAALRGRRSAWVGPLFALGAMGAKVAIVDTDLRVAEIAGAGAAYVVWLVLLLLPTAGRSCVAGLTLSAYVVALRLEPFRLRETAGPFEWLPFFSLMHGSMRIDTLAFLEKIFLYGSILYLPRSAFGGMRAVTVFAAGLLFATSWAETWIPGRSAEITDTIIVLIGASMLALMPPEPDDPASQAKRPPR